MDYRIEHDTMGEVKVPSDKYWGAQTQRSKQNFTIGAQLMPKEVIYAFAILKKAAALANHECGVLPKEKMELIGKVCDEILDGKLDDQFPGIQHPLRIGTNDHLGGHGVGTGGHQGFRPFHLYHADEA